MLTSYILSSYGSATETLRYRQVIGITFLQSDIIQIAIHGSVLTMAWTYVGNLGLSYAAALLLSLVFEAPFLNLQKILGI